MNDRASPSADSVYMRRYLCSWTKQFMMRRPELAKTLSQWSFSPTQLTQLPLDPERENFVRRHVGNAVFSRVDPTPLNGRLQLVGVSEHALVDLLEMDPDIANTEEFVAFVAGNLVLPSSTPLAHRYGGHQFGVWAAQLGDGRAILLGEYTNRAGERWELQLKGAGLTPYSRGADGRAVLRSSIREFLCAEAMYHLRVPTSRVAAIVVSEDTVIRDPLYTGHPVSEHAAVVLRLSPTWFRIGSLEILAVRGEVESLRELVRHVLETLFREEAWATPQQQPGEALVRLGAHVAQLCYKTWLHWQRVGFIHGVLNSDNISLLGVTIDYGPFGFMPAYNPRFVPNSSDSGGRYSYERQLDAVHFDLEKLRAALEVLLAADVKETALRESLVQRMALDFSEARAAADVELELMFLAKLGLRSSCNVTAMLLLAMEETGADFTGTFRQLAEVPIHLLDNVEEVQRHWSLSRVSKSNLWSCFVEQYRAALGSDRVSEDERTATMMHENPCYVLRNWMAQAAIDRAEGGDFSEVHRLHRVLRNPYARQAEAEQRGYGGPPPSWETDLRVSCSS